MIYMIEIDYTDPQSEPEWNAWYNGYVRDLVTVPGILTAQRFLAENATTRRHLAIYTISDLSAYESPRYREIGGGGTASKKWHAHIKRRRNIFIGVDWIPEVRADAALLVTEASPGALDLADVLFVPLHGLDMMANSTSKTQDFGIVPFNGDPKHRYVAIADLSRKGPTRLAAIPALAIYRPSGRRLPATD